MNNTLFTQINLKEQYNENYQYRFKVLSNYIFLPKNTRDMLFCCLQ